jgi:hypothetical protein
MLTRDLMRQLPRARDQLLVRDGDGRPIRFTDRIENEKITDRLGHPQSRRNRRRVLNFLGESFTFFEGANDRRAPGRLNRHHAGTFLPDPSELLHLVERLPHSDQPRPSSRRIHYHVRQRPRGLLGDLVAERLFPFDPVRLAQRR